MKKILSFAALLLAFASLSWAYDFSAVAPTGQTLYYNINGITVSVTYPEVYNTISGALTIPSTVTYNSNTYTVTSIGDSAFDGCFNLISVTIPNSVTSIGNYAFAGCTSLATVSIPNLVTYIGNSAFASCDELIKASIPNSVTYIGDFAFHGLTRVDYSGTIAEWCRIHFGYDWSFGYHLYINNSEVTNLVIPYSVTSIGDFAFFGCDGLATVSISDSVTSIGDNAFAGCDKLTNVTIGNSVTSIGVETFSGCNKLTNVTIGNSVTSIGESAFNRCSSLTNVTIGNSVTSIGDLAFSGCDKLTNVNFTGTIAEWCGISFSGSSSNPTCCAHTLSFNGTPMGTSLTIPNSVGTIGNYAFYNCNGLASVTIGNSVTTIGKGTFSGCSGLTSVTIPNSVTSIGNNAFYHVRNLVYNGTATGSSWGALCVNGYIEGDLVYTDSSKTTLVGCATTATSVTIPNSVTSIGNNAFYGCSGLSTVTIPNSVTSIGNNAFYGCSGLSTVNIPDSVTSIGNNAFYLVRNLIYNGSATGSPWGALCVDGHIEGDLIYTDSSKTTLVGCATTATSVTIPNSVTSIGENAFSNCCNLTNVTFNAINCTTIVGLINFVFSGCTNFTSLTIGDSVQTIHAHVFSGCNSLTNVTFNAINCTTKNGMFNTMFTGCTNLTSLTIGNRVQTIPANVFSGCSGLTNVIIPNSVTSIGHGAFSRCSGLTNIIIPNSVTSIGRSAFAECSSLTNVTIPNSVTSIDDLTFNYCSGLTTVTIGNSVTSIGEGAFCRCKGLTNVIIPNSVSSIGNYAFYGCRSLSTINIPNSVISIGYDAFRSCIGLSTINIPNSVISIGQAAFRSCIGLTEITSLATEAPQLGEDAFLEVTSTIPVNIPCGSSDSYQSRWTYFSNFVERVEFSFSATTSDSSQGVVQVQTEPTCANPTAVIYAAANTGYHFDHWSDDNTENPRTIVLTNDTAIIGYFMPDDSPEGIAEAAEMDGIVIRTIVIRIMVEGIADETVRLFDCMGRCLLTVRATTNCTLQAPAPGVYMLQVSDHPAQRVVVLR